jgi:hypothetical protein
MICMYCEEKGIISDEEYHLGLHLAIDCPWCYSVTRPFRPQV